MKIWNSSYSKGFFIHLVIASLASLATKIVGFVLRYAGDLFFLNIYEE